MKNTLVKDYESHEGEIEEVYKLVIEVEIQNIIEPLYLNSVFI